MSLITAFLCASAPVTWLDACLIPVCTSIRCCEGKGVKLLLQINRVHSFPVHCFFPLLTAPSLRSLTSNHSLNKPCHLHYLAPNTHLPNNSTTHINRQYAFRHLCHRPGCCRLRPGADHLPDRRRSDPGSSCDCHCSRCLCSCCCLFGRLRLGPSCRFFRRLCHQLCRRLRLGPCCCPCPHSGYFCRRSSCW